MTKSQTTPTSTISSAELRRSLDLMEIKPGKKFSVQTLQDLLPDTESVLFFAKVYDLNCEQLSNLLDKVVHSDLTTALFSGDHSTELQDYLVDINDEWEMEMGEVSFDPDIPTGEILPELWASLEVDVANAIKKVAEKLEHAIDMLPGKQGRMVFQSMMKFNKQRPTIGTHQAGVVHDPQVQNLLVLDVSGSMTEQTIRAIIEDVVALAYKANTHFAIVSDNTFYWEPGSFSVDDVLSAAEYWGTHYETLHTLFDRDWGTVITVADYDSSPEGKSKVGKCTGRIDTVLDISLVNRPTYLAEVIGQLAQEVRPILVGRSQYVLESDYDQRYGVDDPNYGDDYDGDDSGL